MDDALPRLPKAVAGELRVLKAYVPPNRWQDIAVRAKLAGMSISSYLNALMDRDEVDKDGRPVWSTDQTSSQPPLVDQLVAA